jgi:hypothetical protein
MFAAKATGYTMETVVQRIIQIASARCPSLHPLPLPVEQAEPVPANFEYVGA